MRSGLRAAILRRRGTFQPTDLGSALKAWWNADDLSSASVSTWTDRIGSLAVTATLTAIPTWGAAGWTVNGKAGVTFDGLANALISTSFASLPGGSTAGEIWALADQQVALIPADVRSIIRYGGTAASSVRALRKVSGATFNAADTTDATVDLQDTVADFSGAHVIGSYFSGTTMGLRLDGADTTPATTTIASLNTGTTRLRIGASNGGAATQFWKGPIRHILVTTALTTAQRQQLEGYLAWDGDIQAKLAIGHPYKNAPP